jgi:hypothetical protein
MAAFTPFFEQEETEITEKTAAMPTSSLLSPFPPVQIFSPGKRNDIACRMKSKPVALSPMQFACASCES